MYYILLLFILLLYSVYNTHDTSVANKKKEDVYCFIICVALVLLAAFRSNKVGADTLGYRLDYDALSKYTTYASLLKRYSIDYIGYYGLSKLFQLMKMPVQVWFGFVEALYLVALMLFIKRFSKDKIFSLLVFVTVGLFTFSMAGLKQTVANAFIMYAFLLFINKRYWLSVPLIILAYYTHPSVMIFVFAFIAYYLRNSKYLVTVCFLSCILIYFYSTLFIGTMIDMLDNNHFQAYNVNKSGYSYVTFIFYFSITLISLLNYKNYKKNCLGSARYVTGMAMLACGLQLLAGVSPSLFRLANLYVPFIMVLLPNTTFYAHKENRTWVKLILMGCVIFYFLYAGRNSQYSFM